MLTLALVLVTLCCGCGSGTSGYVVTGRIVRGGELLQARGRENGTGRVEVRLVPLFEGAETETAIVTENGTFNILAGGKGVPAGKYKIVILALEPAPPDAPTKTGEVDILGGAFSLDRTPLVCDIGEGRYNLGTIDLEKPHC